MVTRRQFLRYGVAAGLVVTPGTRRVARPAAASSGPGWVGAWCDLSEKVEATAVPAETAAVTPFTSPLRIPRVLEPSDTAGGVDRYRITMREAEVEVVPDTTTRIWGYEGEWPGPTIVATRGRPAHVEQVNGLSVPTTVHLHGGRVAPADDGHPNELIAPGGSKVYRYGNAQETATLWYHDHTHHATARQVYRGLAGFYLVTDPAEDALGLPSGERDIPLVIQDRTFATDGSLQYPDGPSNGFFGATIAVNGVPHPSFEVAPARYRFRVLNGSNARPYRLSVDAPMTVIGTDGGLLAAPVDVDAIDISPAERIEVVIDFSGVAPGTSVVLRNERGRDALAEVMRFDVAGSPDGAGRVPARLRDIPTLAGATVTRDIELTLGPDGVWVIDGRRYDATRVDQFPKLGATEVWRVTAPPDRSPMPHPFHVHLVMFQVLDRNGAAPQPWERGWKDTVTVSPGDTVRLIATFAPYTGTYVFHCHNLEHEDHDMMSQFKVVDLPRVAGTDRVATAAAVSAATFEPGVAAAYVATAAAFPDALAGGPAAAVRGAPVLLTTGPSVPAATARELERLRPAEIVVLGGTAAVPASVERELQRYAPVRRIAGQTRYATAAAISRAHVAPGVDTVHVATGTDFPDALAGGAAAAVRGGPVLLVERDELPSETAEELRRLRPRAIVVLGGTAAVSAEVERSLRAFAGSVTRIAGRDRYATAVAVSRSTHATAETVVVATGGDFPDALAGVPAAHLAEAPLLLVAPHGLPDVVRDELARLSPQRIVVLGGEGAVSAEIERRLAALLPDNVAIQP